MVKKIVVSKIMSDEEIASREGTWFDEKDIKLPIINSDADVYRLDDEGNEILLLKFRKRVISDKLIQTGWDSYKDLAKASRGRGASAGPINPDSDYWKKRTLVKTSKWSTGYLNPKGRELDEKLSQLDLDALFQYAISEEILTEKNEFTYDELKMFIIKAKNGINYITGYLRILIKNSDFYSIIFCFLNTFFYRRCRCNAIIVISRRILFLF